MMGFLKRSSLCLCASFPIVVYAATPVIERIDSAASPVLGVPALAMEDPSVRQWQSQVSLSRAFGGYESESRDVSSDPQKGSGERYFEAGADSYIKYKTSTLWGAAAYDNGKQYDVMYNETADIDLVYPYVAADTIGGDISLERYSFSGGYADHRGRLSWGGMVSYKAGLYYRNVDPRPRNITGQLDISAGVGYSIVRDYDLSAALYLRRYTQSNDIDFKSEMGVEKIYHLTGLGHHYSRFAGLGLNAHYGGYRYGASLTLFPRQRRGAFAVVRVSRFTMDKVLRDLNELPMASISHNALNMQLGWLHPSERVDWAVSANMDTYRRHGTENIFGDASSNIYPKIAALDMYADNYYSYGVSALYSYRIGASRLWGMPSVAYTHRRQLYMQPAAERLDEYKSMALSVGISSVIGGKWWAEISARYAGADHYGSALEGTACACRSISEDVALRFSGALSRYKSRNSFRLYVAVVF